MEGGFNTPRIDSATAEKLIAMREGLGKPLISGGAGTSEGQEELKKQTRKKREKKSELPELTEDRRILQRRRASALRGQPHEKKEGGYEFTEGSTLIEQARAEDETREAAKNAAIPGAESADEPAAEHAGASWMTDAAAGGNNDTVPKAETVAETKMSVDREAPGNLPVGERVETKISLSPGVDENPERTDEKREFDEIGKEIRFIAAELYRKAARHYADTGEIEKDLELERKLIELEDRAAEKGRRLGVTSKDIADLEASIAREEGFSMVEFAKEKREGRDTVDELGRINLYEELGTLLESYYRNAGRHGVVNISRVVREALKRAEEAGVSKEKVDALIEEKKRIAGYSEKVEDSPAVASSGAEKGLFSEIEADGRPVIEQLKDVLRGAIEVARAKVGTKDFFDPVAAPHVQAVRRYAERVARMDQAMVSQVINEVLAKEGFDYNELSKVPRKAKQKAGEAKVVRGPEAADSEKKDDGIEDWRTRSGTIYMPGGKVITTPSARHESPPVVASAASEPTPEPRVTAPRSEFITPERTSSEPTPEDLHRIVEEALRHLAATMKNPGNFTEEARRLAREQYDGAVRNYRERH